jgi:hypothetical protein
MIDANEKLVLLELQWYEEQYKSILLRGPVDVDCCPPESAIAGGQEVLLDWYKKHEFVEVKIEGWHIYFSGTKP